MKLEYNSMVFDFISEMGQPLISDNIDTRIKYARQKYRDPEVKEIEIARYRVNHYKTEIIFLPVRDIVNIKNPDILIGCEFAELKYITGGLKAVGKNFRKGTKQAQTIILWIDSVHDFSINDIHNAINGEIHEMIRNKKWDERKPKNCIVIFKNNLHSWRLYKKQTPI